MGGGEPRIDSDRVAPYAAAIAEACRERGVDPFLLAAIGLRETWMGWSSLYRVPPGRPAWDGWGDCGRAYGLFQIDARWHREWVQAAPHPPLVQARYALSVLENGRAALHRRLPELAPEDLLHAAIAAYNAGPSRVARALTEGKSADAPTTGGDYGLDVLRRADHLRRESPFLFAEEVA